ncbi:MAG: hypothetical protein QG597_1534, partial [Actinomycetota bacterium]|nr:hypothetical protein [Actinomycetota bacterium]
MSRRLTAVFASNDAPLAITGIVLSAVSGLLAAGLCTLVDARVVPVGLVIGAILGFIAASAPMFMALRLILLAGLLLVASATFGTLLQHSAIVAALVMAAVAFVTAIWTALPVVGTIFSSLPATVFILLLAKGDEFAKGAPALVVALAGLLAMLPPSLLAVAVSIRDPRKFDRAMTAALWSRTTPANSRGTYSRVLLLDGAPSTLLYLAAHGSLGMVCRSWLENNSDGKDPAVAAAMAQGDANGDAIAAALLPRGPLVPRSAPVDTTAMAPAAARDPAASQADIAGQTTAAWSLWAASQQRSQAALAGDTPQRVAVRPVLLILASLVRNLVHPDVSVFRYGVQRALALGVGAFALVQSRGDENVFWVVISLAAVLQANAPSTVEKVARRSVGTFGGVLLAVALSLILPSRLLVPWVAGVALVAGFA